MYIIVFIENPIFFVSDPDLLSESPEAGQDQETGEDHDGRGLI